MKNSKTRLDQLLVQKGLAESRERAKAIIMAGHVRVDGILVDKPGFLIPVSASVSLKKPSCSYASRGGLKLEAALKHFSVDVDGL
ncbi:MAG: TlyA family rRNA (cytidine-2'-O)-methyltransferase, partial [Desulfobacteraceae bacterium]|nr:TlyA family rRNA (cytidine-2'-O)-methyltransferase [Desulfobacteraceae bacterium]